MVLNSLGCKGKRAGVEDCLADGPKRVPQFFLQSVHDFDFEQEEAVTDRNGSLIKLGLYYIA